jgi:mannose-6-phosphate isomerase-like protein (cupin superfamily)
MADYSVAKVDDIEGAHGGIFKGVRAALNGTAFGINVLDLPPNFADYPEHSHSEDQQEEIYTALAGSATLDIEGNSVPLEPGTFVRVAPGTNRKILPGADGVRVLAVGCAAGSYEAGGGA